MGQWEKKLGDLRVGQNVGILAQAFDGRPADWQPHWAGARVVGVEVEVPAEAEVRDFDGRAVPFKPAIADGIGGILMAF